MNLNRWLNVAAVAGLLLAGYVAAYRWLPDRSSGYAHTYGAVTHDRDFRYGWQASLFAPAGFVEAQIILANPKPFVSDPRLASLRQMLILDGGNVEITFPREEARRRARPR